MYLPSVVLLCLLLSSITQIQCHPCSCSCCFGQGCQASLMPQSVDAPQCTDASCLEVCRTRYYQCSASPPYGQAIAKCLTATTTTTASPLGIGGPYSCQCSCCNTGSYTCSPSHVGYTNAYSCQVGTCSIACTKQYPYVCVNNQYGQTQGTCVGITTSTPMIPAGSMRCGCSCYGASGYQQYETTTTNGCSSCLASCQAIQLQCSAHQNTYCAS